MWTGAELILWGGWELESIPDPNPELGADGAAWDPARDRWRSIADAPLSPRAGHLTTWTGREMLILGGWPGRRNEPPDGAAYDPETDRWRPIATAPLGRAPQGGAWTGTEWIVVANAGDDRSEVAAYDPAADSWRSLPSLPGSFTYETYLVWTGDEIVLRESTIGMYHMRPDGDEWLPIPDADDEPAIRGSLVWTGQLVVGKTYGNLSTEVGGWDPWSYLTAWDPTTGEKVELPKPPGNAYGSLLWIQDHLVPLGSGYAFHPPSGQWRELPTPGRVDRIEAVTVWAGDRLIIWGGALGSHGGAIDDGLILTPDW